MQRKSKRQSPSPREEERFKRKGYSPTPGKWLPLQSKATNLVTKRAQSTLPCEQTLHFQEKSIFLPWKPHSNHWPSKSSLIFEVKNAWWIICEIVNFIYDNSILSYIYGLKSCVWLVPLFLYIFEKAVYCIFTF